MSSTVTFQYTDVSDDASPMATLPPSLELVGQEEGDGGGVEGTAARRGGWIA
jgi:hypothetical protein